MAVSHEAEQASDAAKPTQFRVVCHSCRCDVLVVKHKRHWLHWVVAPIGVAALIAAYILLATVYQNELHASRVLRQANLDLKVLGVSDADRTRLINGWELTTSEYSALTPPQLDAVRSMYARLHPMRASNDCSLEASRSVAATKHLFAACDTQIPLQSIRAFIQDGVFPPTTIDEPSGAPLVRAISSDARMFESALMASNEFDRAPFLRGTPAFLGTALLVVGMFAMFLTSRFGFRRRLTCPSCSGCAELAEPRVGEQQLRARKVALAGAKAAEALRESRATEIKEVRKYALRDMKTAERVIRHKCRMNCIPSPYLERPEQSLGKFVASVLGGWQARVDARLNTVMRFFRCAGRLVDREFQRALGAYLISFYMESQKRWSIWGAPHKSERDYQAGWRYIDAQDVGIAMLFIGSGRNIQEFETYLHTLARASRHAESEWDPAAARARIPSGLRILRATIGPEIDGY